MSTRHELLLVLLLIDVYQDPNAYVWLTIIASVIATGLKNLEESGFRAEAFRL